MNEITKYQLYKKVKRKLFRPLARLYTLPPYEYVQNDVERNLWMWLGVNQKEITLIVIIGGYLADEVLRMKKYYPNAVFVVFEASKRYYDRLSKRFRDIDRVKTFNCAISNKTGAAQFFETNLKGSGSLLSVGELARTSYAAENRESFSVKTYQLDDHIKEFNWLQFTNSDKIDLLWIDVQGAEEMVIEGASQTLTSCRSVMLEVSRWEPLYQGGAVMDRLEYLMAEHGFLSMALGLDAGNGTGNQFFCRRKA